MLVLCDSFQTQPGAARVPGKIRQQLQVLRDLGLLGLLAFLAPGSYRLL
ncbi:MAG: hypothetical protein WA789_07050 [Candidatus Acidiferrum sp.]